MSDQAQSSPSAPERVNVSKTELDELTGGAASGSPLGLAQLLDVSVRVTVEVGRAKLTLADLVQLAPGSLIQLDREAHEPVDILVNGKVVARGEIVTIDQSYGVRITSVSKAG
ncbi:MAG: flagellar motor switch protein FliN [Planctomycetes bacterium]|jgi:flagellar motor switch protein FliN/FliY|nr:flagellar motor switch protein FliN [Planctomycetota bacterium]